VIIPESKTKGTVTLKEIQSNGDKFDVRFFNSPTDEGFVEAATSGKQVAVLKQPYNAGTLNGLFNTIDAIPTLKGRHQPKRKRLINIDVDASTNKVYTTRYCCEPSLKQEGAFKENYHTAKTFEDYEEYGDHIEELLQQAKLDDDYVTIRIHIKDPMKESEWMKVIELRDKFITVDNLYKTSMFISVPTPKSGIAAMKLTKTHDSENGPIQANVVNDATKIFATEDDLANDVLSIVYDDNPNFDNRAETTQYERALLAKASLRDDTFVPIKELDHPVELAPKPVAPSNTARTNLTSVRAT
jgi:hypothetical protein